ncbi:MAG: glycosyltransferase family 2 protein [Chloroflexota bacterium]|nr:glycosyltransferase family 2 protein [Chloroflexota bacterium]
MTDRLADTTVIIPARNEAAAIAGVVRSVRALGPARVIVVDDASTDATAAEARRTGADVVPSRGRGYGWACHAGAAAVDGSRIVAFIDGDGSFDPGDLASLAQLVRDGADLAVGTRIHARAMPLHQRLGNGLTLALLRVLYGLRLGDIAPLRAIRVDALERLEMRPTRYAWLVEMLAKAARRRLHIVALPVRYGPRIGGVSKVSGSPRGSLLAGIDFLGALLLYRHW